MSTILTVNHLNKQFNSAHGQIHAVEDVSFTVEENKTLGIVGESGCGKSTLGRTIISLIPPTSGEVYFDGTDITKLKKRELIQYRQKMQMIFQDPSSSLDPRMSVHELIEEPLIVAKRYPNAAERAKQVRNMMDTVGLAARFEHAYPHELDGGRRQRIGIARALILDPKFVVCDEPVSALDVSIQAQILNLLQDLQKAFGLTYIFITHDLAVVNHISDTILVMYMGAAVEMASVDEMFTNPKHPYTHGLFSAIPVPELRPGRKRFILKGEVTKPDGKPGCKFAPRCPKATEECFSKTPKMREIASNHQIACHNVE